MRWQSSRATWIMCGTLVVLFGLSALPARSASPAVPLAQPSPRPTLPPTAPPEPTSAPSRESRNEDPEPTRVRNPGHITGTVIDSASGAPASGKRVNVGGVVVMTDGNGNYDRWVPPGTYTVTLVLDTNEGTSLLPPQVADLPEGGRTVVHLSFRSTAPAAAPTAAPAPPAAPAPTAAPAPPAGGTRPNMPGTLPRTGDVAEPPAAPAPQPKAEPASTPKRLPRTGDTSPALWLWLALGLMLICTGMVSLRAARVRVAYAIVRGDMDDQALLARLLRVNADDQRLLSRLLQISEE